MRARTTREEAVHRRRVAHDSFWASMARQFCQTEYDAGLGFGRLPCGARAVTVIAGRGYCTAHRPGARPCPTCAGTGWLAAEGERPA